MIEIDPADVLIVDFETRSRCLLPVHGADRYAVHPSTQVLCAAFMTGDPNVPKVFTWRMGRDGPEYDTALVDFINGHKYIAAVNARFDALIWDFVADFLPDVDPSQWYCIAAQSRLNGLPSSLDDATRALDTKHKKDAKGKALIKRVCVPDKFGEFSESALDHDALFQYCIDDVKASKDLMLATRMMDTRELEDWQVNERVNDLGIRVDTNFAKLATSCAGAAVDEVSKELDTLTGGKVTKPTQHHRIKMWMIDNAPMFVVKEMERVEDGVVKHSLDDSTRQRILAMPEIQQHPITRDIIELVASASKSSVAKYQKMIDLAEPSDDRVRGSFVFAGASTGRFSSRGLQVHNFKRDSLDAMGYSHLQHCLVNGTPVPHLLKQLSKALRPTLRPSEGNVFVVCDWSSIENRMLPFLSDSRGGDKKLDAFKRYDLDPKNNLDSYQVAARDAGLTDRQIGKVIELSLGYLGSTGAFNSMAQNYGVVLPEKEVLRIIGAWRQTNAWCVDFGNALEKAAVRAIKNPNRMFKAGRVRYIFDPELMGGSLHCLGPSGAIITYPKARYSAGEGLSALKANLTMGQDATEWPRFSLWRGLLLENITQGECAALLRNAMKCLDGKNVVLHCHDELLLDVPRERAETSKTLLQTTMETPPTWATGLPLAAPAGIMERYGKG